MPIPYIMLKIIYFAKMGEFIISILNYNLLCIVRVLDLCWQAI